MILSLSLSLETRNCCTRRDDLVIARDGAYAHFEKRANYVGGHDSRRRERERERERGGRIPKQRERERAGRCLPAVTFKRWSKYKTLARIKETNSWRAQYELNMLINN